jgi:hypothetical protein
MKSNEGKLHSKIKIIFNQCINSSIFVAQKPKPSLFSLVNWMGIGASNQSVTSFFNTFMNCLEHSDQITQLKPTQK